MTRVRLQELHEFCETFRVDVLVHHNCLDSQDQVIAFVKVVKEMIDPPVLYRISL